MFTKAYHDTTRGPNNWNTTTAWYQESACVWFRIAADDIGLTDELVWEWQQSKTNSAKRAATARYMMGIREVDYDV